MNHEEQPSDHRERNQWSSPGRVPTPADSAERLRQRNTCGKYAKELVLDDFNVLAEKCFCEAERADRPGVMVTPDQKKDRDDPEGAGEDETGPDRPWIPQGEAQLGQPE